ncbi:hypothetical protein BSR29_02135 [Boudabousia liubingyangii]|uniref:Glycosyl hydrolase n=1 Tax=Boudabousia liubingyangii TaxID=1921764 RepID=A0A1Q5PQ73_9ACTO|nr:hypothetical protein [Boudabousia liubingyangii]OKL49768.1 hypothetical protein BSR29_02135 [Boudabousia liubingyangii]
MAENHKVHFGVNYTPRQGWFHSWLDFDPKATREDLEQIASLGCDHVRIFPLWPLIQPNRTLIRESAIKQVVRLVEIAGECGLDVYVDVLQGHLSSFDFLPSWVESWHRQNLFTSPKVISGQRTLVGALGAALSELPNARGLGIGNEFIQFAAPRHPQQHEITSQEAGHWLDELFAEAKQVWPEGKHAHSFDDDLWFDAHHPFTPELGVTRGDITTVHSWIFGALGLTYGADHQYLPMFARYLVDLAAAYQRLFLGTNTGPIWLQEVGAPSTHLSRGREAEFVRHTLEFLLGRQEGEGGGAIAGTEHLAAVTWWCSHDVSRQLADFPALEYDLGLFDEDGQVKPEGQAFAQVISDYRDGKLGIYSLKNEGDPGQSILRVGLTRDGSDRNLLSPAGAFFQAWAEQAINGQVPKIELSHKN